MGAAEAEREARVILTQLAENPTFPLTVLMEAIVRLRGQWEREGERRDG